MGYYNYAQISQALIKHKSNKFVKLFDFFVSSQNIGLNRTAIQLYDQLIIAACNRPNGALVDIYVSHIGLNIKRLKDFKKWLYEDKPMYPRIDYMLELYSAKELYDAFHLLIKLELIESSTYKSSSIILKYPIENKMLPLVYAYNALLYRFKIENKLNKDVTELIKSTPILLKKKYSKLSKEQLIDLIIEKQISPIELKKITKHSQIFKSLMYELTNYIIPNALATYLKPYHEEKIFNIEDSFNDFFDEIRKTENLTNEDIKKINIIKDETNKTNKKEEKINIEPLVHKDELNSNSSNLPTPIDILNELIDKSKNNPKLDEIEKKLKKIDSKNEEEIKNKEEKNSKKNTKKSQKNLQKKSQKKIGKNFPNNFLEIFSNSFSDFKALPEISELPKLPEAIKKDPFQKIKNMNDKL